jgi:hypothetical protein
MDLFRLTRGHLVAAAAALALMVFMALDWYSTDFGEEARRIEEIQGEPEGALAGQVTREVTEEASIQAEEEEENAWQANGVLDRVVLALLVGTVLLALAAAGLRAAGRRYVPPLTPSVIAAIVAGMSAVLVAARIVDEGAIEVGGAVELGAPLGLLAVGTIALGAALAARAERAERAETEATVRG